MPAAKLGTVVDNVGMTVRNMKAGSTYKERTGVIRLSIGQLGFSPEELRTNLRALITQIKKDAAGVSDVATKEIKEVVCQYPYLWLRGSLHCIFALGIAAN